MCVSLVRVDRARTRTGQALIPIAILAVIAARYVDDAAILYAAVACEVLAFAVLLSAWRRFGTRELTVRKGSIRFGDPGPRIRACEVVRWTLQGGVARVYTVKAGWKLSIVSGQPLALEQALSPVLGKALSLRHRGSRRARAIALAVMLAGVALTGISFYLDSLALAVPGAPAMTLGLATFGALTQKVTDGE